MAEELIWKSAHELTALYRSKDVSPVEVVEAVLARLEEVEPSINAMVTVTAEQARDQAVAAERAFLAGGELPPLLGVPITVKDLVDTAGVRTTHGCLAYSDRIPDTDAIAWARLKAAGAILIGKTTTPEFGLLGVTESHLTGTTATPWDPARTSGGSSGGAAAAVAAGVGPLAWGSDGGGSIRVPSSVCGAVGFKPTTGRIPMAGNTEPDSTEGPITRSVADAAILMDITAGPDVRDRLALPCTSDLYQEAALTAGDLSGLRVAANVDLGQGPIDRETRRVFSAALLDLAAAGAVVEEVPIALPDTLDYFIAYWGAEYIDTVEELRRLDTPIWPFILEVADAARALSAVDVSRAVRKQKTEIYDAFAAIHRDFDIFVCPTTPIPAFPHAGDKGGLDMVDGQRVRHPGIYFHRLTEPPSHAGLPAISVPCGFTAEGLPVGMQMVGAMYQDVTVLSAAARYQNATEWHQMHPPLGA